MGEKSSKFCARTVVFIAENRFALSTIVFEKMDIKVGVRIRPKFKFYAAVASLC